MLGNNGLSIFGDPSIEHRLLGISNIRNKAFFVSERSGVGSNDNPGTDPRYPVADLETAYGLCTTNLGDYIFVLDFWTATAPPLTINKRDIHLISMGTGNFDNGNDITTSTANKAAVCIEDGGIDFEMAGFNLSSSGTSGVALEMGEAYRAYIHHCTFGCNIAATTGMAAMTGGGSFTHSTLENCLFGTLLTGNSIYVSLNTSIIRNNRFLATAGVCISVPSTLFTNTIIEGNKFLVDDATHGDAINLSTTSASANMIDDNIAMNGNALSDYSYNPYRDVGTTKSHWGRNWRGNELIEPYTV